MRSPTVTLLVRQRLEGARDRLGNEVVRHGDPVGVDGCLWAPGTPEGLPVERPEGVRLVATAHFPRGHGLRLRGAKVSLDGELWLDVVGDPMPYPDAACRGPWSTFAPLRRSDG